MRSNRNHPATRPEQPNLQSCASPRHRDQGARQGKRDDVYLYESDQHGDNQRPQRPGSSTRRTCGSGPRRQDGVGTLRRDRARCRCDGQCDRLRARPPWQAGARAGALRHPARDGVLPWAHAHHPPGLLRGPLLRDAPAAVLRAVAQHPGQGGRAAPAHHRIGRRRAIQQLGVQRLAAVLPPARAAPPSADQQGTGRALSRLPASARDAGRAPARGRVPTPRALHRRLCDRRPGRGCRGPRAGAGARVAAARRRCARHHRPRGL